jgi:Zn-finger protein
MSFDFFSNKECEYYPCHDLEEINCLFCYCPLYNVDCDGNYKILTGGIKDCSGCVFPHLRANYKKIINKIIENNADKIKNNIDKK